MIDNLSIGKHHPADVVCVCVHVHTHALINTKIRRMLQYQRYVVIKELGLVSHSQPDGL